MTNTFVRPLEIKYDNVDPTILSAVRKINAAAGDCGIDYFLAGAMAREIMLRHVFGRGPGRRTLDVDFGIAVTDWDQFEALKRRLIDQADFEAHPKQRQRLRDKSTSVIVDLIPFGGVERSNANILWPPEEDTVMRVSGFKDALLGAVAVRLLPDLVVPVVSLPLLLVLKLFAWVDRRSEKRDAADIYTLLRQYGDAGNEDRLYQEHLPILEAEGFDFELAGAVLLGLDAASLVSSSTREELREILDSSQNMEGLITQMVASSSSVDNRTAAQCELVITKLRLGFSQFTK